MTIEPKASELRKTGIDVIGDVRWGTHFCCFYETKHDLLETLVLYFKAGLENKEFCLWVVSQPLGVEEAKRALAQTVPDLNRHLVEGGLEIQSHDEWYLHEGECESQRVLRAWREKLNQALAKGYTGLRASGDGGWTLKDEWMVFREYEKQVDALVANQRKIILCTYPLATSSGAQVFDLTCTHQVAVARRQGSWEIIETPALKQAKAEITRLNDQLEQKVKERTKELATTNEALKRQIMERKEIREALNAQALRYKTLMATSTDSIYVLDEKGNLQEANPAFLRRRGYTAIEAKSLNVADWDAQFSREQLQERMRKWVGSSQVFETRHRCKDGSIFEVEVCATSVRIAGEQFTFYMTRDITERKQAEDRLRRSEEKFKALFRIAPVGISILDGQHNVVEANAALEQITRLSKEELLNGTWRRRTYLNVDGTHKPQNEMASARAIMANRPFNDVETGIVTENGEIIWTQVSVAPLALSDASAVVITRDVTERKRAAKELEEANHRLRILSRRLFEVQEEERRHLARELHDEIGQALTAAKINLQSVTDNSGSPNFARRQETIAILDHLLVQVRQISLDLRPSTLDDLGLIPALRSLLDEQGRRASVAVRFSTGNVPEHLAPEIQTTCFRVAQEAITNAVRHADATRIGVDLQCENGKLRLLIRDNGRGFDVDSAQAQTIGLGLIGIRERASLVDGDAKIISSPTEGTTIEVSLPAAFPSERPVHPGK